MLKRKRSFPLPALLRRAALALLLGLAGCDYVVQPLKGLEGRTQVYAAVGKLGAPNAGIVVSSIGAVVIDPPLTPVLGARLNADALVRSRAFWDELYKNRKERQPTQAPPVLYVLNTTYRASHTFGNQAFRNSADFIATEKAGRHLASIDANRRMREILKTEFKVPGLEEHAVTESVITFEGTLTVRTPEVEVKMLSVGDCLGEGDAVVLLPQQKVLFAGDVVLVGFMPYYEGRTPTVRNWIAALRNLEKMDLDIVVPGHGPVGGKELLKQQREFLEALVAEVNKALSAGHTAEQAAKDVRLPNYAAWARYNEWLGENVKLVCKELSTAAPEKPETPATGAGAGAPLGLAQQDAFHAK